MVVPLFANQVHFHAEKLRQQFINQDAFLWPIRQDASFLQQHHPFDLRNDLGHVVCYQQYPKLVSRNSTCPPMSSAFPGSSKSSVCGSCTSARAISVRFASPDDIAATGRSAS